ncbi:DUF2190 family protein [Aureimonas pseudogalii]|uniref:Putative RecA/RadA family phage recombinase n=1 Tax=Aureimonas pseudogalii TaxID=1744844 RepID=A0A7W6MKB2_9HYPH|nr:DUF2190 family protein [Aureimonas pseudogalii]MBB3998875.1 putative RecA/RadA family phage recombinase [Aureimonas pseudogalii]
MKNYVQKGENITVPAPAVVLSGAPVLIGKLFGIAAGDALQGEPLDLVTTGVFTLPKVSTQPLAIGDKLYFDTAAGLVTTTASGNSYIGVAVKPAANPSGAAEVRLNGFVA